MNPILYFKGFSWLALIGLSCSVLSTFWLPMLIGAAVLVVLSRLVR